MSQVTQTLAQPIGASMLMRTPHRGCVQSASASRRSPKGCRRIANRSPKCLALAFKRLPHFAQPPPPAPMDHASGTGLVSRTFATRARGLLEDEL